jgi:hypothetical protein
MGKQNSITKIPMKLGLCTLVVAKLFKGRSASEIFATPGTRELARNKERGILSLVVESSLGSNGRLGNKSWQKSGFGFAKRV